MQKTPPSAIAITVNHQLHGKPGLNAAPALRSLEDQYDVRIRITHTGAEITADRGDGKVLYTEGDVGAAKGGRTSNPDERGRMIHYAITLLHWASENMPTREVMSTLTDVCGGRH